MTIFLGENISKEISFTAYEEKKREEMVERGKIDKDRTRVEGAEAEFDGVLIGVLSYRAKNQ